MIQFPLSTHLTQIINGIRSARVAPVRFGMGPKTGACWCHKTARNWKFLTHSTVHARAKLNLMESMGSVCTHLCSNTYTRNPLCDVADGWAGHELETRTQTRIRWIRSRKLRQKHFAHSAPLAIRFHARNVANSYETPLKSSMKHHFEFWFPAGDEHAVFSLVLQNWFSISCVCGICETKAEHSSHSSVHTLSDAKIRF